MVVGRCSVLAHFMFLLYFIPPEYLVSCYFCKSPRWLQHKKSNYVSFYKKASIKNYRIYCDCSFEHPVIMQTIQ